MSLLLPQPARRAERGAVSWVTLLLILLVAGGAYLVLTWGPVYVLHYEAKQVARDYMNQAVKDPDDATLVKNMTLKLASLDTMEVLGEDGKPTQVPVVSVAPEDVAWERHADATPPTLHVAFRYRRIVNYPFLKRWTEREFGIDLTEDISRPDWGPAR